MKTPLKTLDDLRGDSPCPLDRDELAGSDRVRHCDVCGQEVLNLSALTREEAERAVANPTVGCVRLLRREDGTAITADSPEDRRTGRLLAGAAVGLLLALTVGCSDTTPSPPRPDAEGCLKRDDKGKCVQWMGK
ncbi:MAG: hypothetical protein K8U57_11875 [Planctomycetes bacterium]|nr:hypothetical protein [Planctomycetota bacterium]